MKKKMTITEELKAIQTGELPCSDSKRAICVTYCRRRIKALQDIKEPNGLKAAIAARLTGKEEKIRFYSEFIAWAEKQPGGAE